MITVNALSLRRTSSFRSVVVLRRGTDDLLETIEKTLEPPESQPADPGVVITLHDRRTTLGRDIQTQIDGSSREGLQDDDLKSIRLRRVTRVQGVHLHARTALVRRAEY